MKLLFDLQASQPNMTGKVHGGGRYTVAVLRELAGRVASGQLTMECVYDARRPLPEEAKEILARTPMKLHDTNQESLQQILNEGGFKVYYSARNELNEQLPPEVRMIFTVHGLRELENPRDWLMLRYRNTLYRLLRSSVTMLFRGLWNNRVVMRRYRSRLMRPNARFVAVSEHTKYACLSYFPELRAEDIKVFYSPSTGMPRHDLKPYSPGYRYVMMVSGNRYDKNALRALQALDEIMSERPELADIHVVVTGAGEHTIRFKPSNPDRIHYMGYVDDDTLESLYKGAELFLYPSYNEGFGYPPVEAMKYGTPVAASAVTSIPEVCGEGVLYFNPFDIKEIKGRILRMLLDPELKQEYSHRALKRFDTITKRQNADLKRLADFICNQ